MGLKKRLQNMMVAITFAEAGEFDTARQIMGEESYVKDKYLRTGAGQRLGQKEKRITTDGPRLGR